MPKSKIKINLFLALIVFGVFLALPALAQNLNTGIDYGAYTGLVDTDPRIIIARIINVALGFLGAVALVLVLYGGFKYMTASGNEEEVAKAKKILLNAAIGLAIILSAFAITRFVISKLTDAIIGQAINNEQPPCEGPDCEDGTPIGGGAKFFATLEPQGQLPIMNPGVIISFRTGGFGGPAAVNRSDITAKNVAVTTADGFVFTNLSGFEFTAPDIVKFHATGSCAPANPAANDCFGDNTAYKITLSGNIKDTNGKQLDCATHTCQFAFTTGDKYDASPPAVEMIQPGNNAILEHNEPAKISAGYSDDAGVKQVIFFADKAGVKSTIQSVAINPFEVSGTKETNWTPILSEAEKPEFFDLYATADDLDSHTAESAKQTVKVLPRFCFNGQQDAGAPAFETDKDCGGPICGSCPGGSCNSNLDCAGSFCDLATHTCVARPKITNVELKDGAVGNYVTIFGKYFGNTPGQVVFLGGAGEGDDKISALVNSQCTPYWHDNYIIVAVPTGAKTGPIEVKKTGAVNVNDRDITNDSWGPDFANTVFLVNSEDRPGLCSANPTTGGPNLPIVVYGDNLSAGGVLNFGDFAAGTSNWNNQSINTVVPNLPTQAVSIFVTLAGGKNSNSLPFIIGSLSGAIIPRIDQLTPTSSPIGTLITITGRNFGETTGLVEFQQGATTIPASPPPAGCPSAWSPTQIIVRVPPGLSQANAKVLVKTGGAGSLSSNQVDFLVNNDPIPPGLCALVPDNGPANTVVTLKGEGFGTSGLVRYWSGAQATTSGWQDNQVISAVPANAKTGAVIVKNTANAVDSNPLDFKVQDCRVNPALCTGGDLCCPTGSCQAQCASGPKASVYSWSFSTGRLPIVPYVVEECGIGIVPSPSPYFNGVNRTGPSDNVCVNAQIQVRFNTLIKDAALTGFKVDSCGTDSTCATPTQFNGSWSRTLLNPLYGYTGSNVYDTFIFTPNASPVLLAVNTWYRVTVERNNISSFYWDGTAEALDLEAQMASDYEYKFKTRDSTELCKLGSAIVGPDKFTSREFLKTYYLETDKTFYSVTALSDKNICWALDPYAYDWTWNAGPFAGTFSSPVYAEVTNEVDAVTNKGKPIQDLLTKNIETLSTGEKVWVKTFSAGDPVSDDALLYIKLTNPKILEYWPNCNAACVNAGIGAKFNVKITNPGVNINKVQLCGNNGAVCATASENLITGVSVNDINNTSELVFSHDVLLPDKEYRVIIKGGSGGVKSDQNIELDTTSLNYNCSGSPPNQICTDFSWTFRTKSDPDKCAVASVEVNPAESIVYWVGAKAPVYGLPRGAKDACSPFGQRLDSWDYDWAWATVDTNVATVTNSNRGKPSASQACSDSCLRPGGRPASQAVCEGNSVFGALPTKSTPIGGGNYGETQATVKSAEGDTVAVEENTSWYTCVDNIYSTARLFCGNSSSTYTFAFPKTDKYIFYARTANSGTDSSKQLHLIFYLDGVNIGSVNNPSATTTASINWASNVSAGQHQLTVQWDNDDGFLSDLVLVKVGFKLASCGSSAENYCGDGVQQLNLGEECDKGVDNDKAGSGCTINCLTIAKVYGKTAGKCGDGVFDSGNKEECDGGRWCNDNCQNKGSNQSYGSVCGDGGSLGQGEDCEPGNDTADSNNDPWQLAKAIGNGTVNVKKQQVTDIKATTENKTGLGKFILQCGYEPLNAACPTAPGTPVPTKGVGADSCCYARPTAVMSQPPFPSGSDNICPNTALVVRFDQKMDVNSLTPDTVLLGVVSSTIGSGGCLKVGLSVLPQPGNWWQKIAAFVKNLFGWQAQALDYCANDIGYTVSVSSTFVGTAENTNVRLNLVKPLNFNTEYRIFIKGLDKARNSKGVTVKQSLELDDFIFDFTTKSEICKIDHIAVSPETSLLQTTFPDPSDNDPTAGAGSDDQINDIDKIYSVKAYYKNIAVPGSPDAEIVSFSTVYNWTYAWSNDNMPVVSMAPVNLDNVLVTAIKNGLATLTAVATVDVDTSAPSGVGKEYKDTGLVQVFLCENPWPDSAVRSFGLGYVDVGTEWDTMPTGWTSGGVPKGNAWTNFKLMYCRDAGKSNDKTDDLPSARQPAVLLHPNYPADGMLKEFFLTFLPPSDAIYPQPNNVKDNKDGIGLRVYPNDIHLTLLDWYNSQHGDAGKGAPVPTKVGLYDALQEGRTFYISGLNVSPALKPAVIYSNIYVFSFSNNPTPETLNVVNQLMANFTLNTNDILFNTSPPLTDKKDILDKMYRDFKRIQDLQLITNKLWSYYQKNNTYPNLTENASLGTYLPSYTNSKWRSWQGVLGNLLSYNLPNDPLNGFYGCGSSTLGLADYDSATCWNATNQTFVCPAGSHIYQYTTEGGSKVKLQADFELDTNDYIWAINLDTTRPAGMGDSINYQIQNSCNATVQGNSNRCGDGIIGTYEVAGVTKTEVCEIGQKRQQPCVIGGYPGKKYERCKKDCSDWEPDRDPGLISWWPAEGNVNDAAGNNNGTYIKDVSYAAGKAGKAFKFVYGSHLSMPDADTLNSPKITVSAWIYKMSDARYMAVAGKYYYYETPSRNSGSWFVDVGNNNNLRCYMNIGGSWHGVTTEADTVPSNQWKHAVCTFDGSQVRIYINGRSLPSWSVSALGNLVYSDIGKDGKPHELGIGAVTDNTDYQGHFDGLIDELKIYDRALSTAEINDIYSGKKSDSPSCVPQGSCGDGKIQTTSVPSEQCDDGANNGKYGYCTTDCSLPTTGSAGGYCGNGHVDAGKEACDLNGAVYNREKANSCSWDCQSFDYCGDDKVNSTYEECEKNESCQVGTCSNNAKVYCETDANCISGGICQNKQPGKRYCHAPGEIMPDLDNADTYLLFKDKKDGQGQYVKEVEGVNAGCRWVSVGNSFTPFLMNTTCLPLKYEQVYSASNCGNGTLDVGEICDAGTQNGHPCDNFSQAGTCTYCAYGCQQVVTVQEIPSLCGNGTVDTDERCDLGANNGSLICDNGGVVDCKQCNGDCYNYLTRGKYDGSDPKTW